MNLEETSASLANQFGELTANDSRKWEGFFSTLGKIGFGGFGTVVVIGFFWLIYLVIGKMISGGMQPAFGLLLIMFVVFAALMLVYVIYNEAIKDKRAERTAQPAVDLRAPDTGRLLTEPVNQSVPSVIDNTTELLKIETKTRKLQ